ncbi:hypothetical protein [Blastococcus sp. Marseille-P5729]|uniref:hypothetical protein n=1 Tax=Blastococcus sp. Marseille-P5729 TaxID=2086582 RepID=UPI00131AD6FF|nr:hypothetical protein [Blastococcus sp. Marseille-P5729]
MMRPARRSLNSEPDERRITRLIVACAAATSAACAGEGPEGDASTPGAPTSFAGAIIDDTWVPIGHPCMLLSQADIDDVIGPGFTLGVSHEDCLAERTAGGTSYISVDTSGARTDTGAQIAPADIESGDIAFLNEADRNGACVPEGDRCWASGVVNQMRITVAVKGVPDPQSASIELLDRAMSNAPADCAMLTSAEKSIAIDQVERFLSAAIAHDEDELSALRAPWYDKGAESPLDPEAAETYQEVLDHGSTGWEVTAEDPCANQLYVRFDDVGWGIGVYRGPTGYLINDT